MVTLAEGLPVTLIPEQALVAAMRHDVIDYGCGRRSAGIQAHHAEWMLPQESCTRFLPLGVVATLPERAAASIMLTFTLRSRSRM
jgi:hypothetical protein